jgi:glycosyltransferase involved in cell wall biosynthesis
LKIVINAHSAKVGGGRTYLVNLLRRLPTGADLAIELFAPVDLDVGADPRVVRVATRWPVHNPVLRSLWERIALPRYLRRTRADVLFCPGGIVNTRAPEGVKVVTMFRNMLPFDRLAAGHLGLGLARLRNRVQRSVMLRSMASADLVIFISAHARTVIERMIRVRRGAVIPHGVAPQFRTAGAQPDRPKESGAGAYLLYVSRFEAYKHHREVIEAFAALAPAVASDLRLLLAGEADSAQGRQARAQIARLGLAGRVELLGGVPYDRLPALYAHARAVIFASSCENCPNILLEALGAGRPLLSSDIQPMPEFGGPDIAYFDPRDPQSLREALEHVLTDPDHAARLAAASLERSRHYDWDRTARATWEAITALAGRDRRTSPEKLAA